MTNAFVVLQVCRAVGNSLVKCQFVADEDKTALLKKIFNLKPVTPMHYLGLFPNWDSRLLLPGDFPVLFGSGCCLPNLVMC